MGAATVYLLVTSSAFFWGANFVLAGPVLADLAPLWAAPLRFLLGAAVMLLIVTLRREQLLALLRRHAGTYLLLAGVGVAGFNLLFFYALQSTSAANAALIMATNPLITTLLAAVILGERPTARYLVSLPVALVGVTVVITHGEWHRLASFHVAGGDLLMLAANLSWALYNVLGRRYMPQGTPLANTTLIMSMGAVLLLCFALGSGIHFATPGIKADAALLAMALGGTVLAYLFWSIGIMRLGAARTAIFLNLVPVFTMLVGLIIGTLPSVSQIAGGLLVIGGVTISMLPSRRPVEA
jgi:drug/metabolite transporter (DMT)-like permease